MEFKWGLKLEHYIYTHEFDENYKIDEYIDDLVAKLEDYEKDLRMIEDTDWNNNKISQEYNYQLETIKSQLKNSKKELKDLKSRLKR